jgi:hypothetical protein
VSEKIRHISPQNDSENKRTEIFKFITKINRPISLAEIAQTTHSLEKETEHHLDALREKGWIDYIPAGGGNWGFVLKNR